MTRNLPLFARSEKGMRKELAVTEKRKASCYYLMYRGNSNWMIFSRTNRMKPIEYYVQFCSAEDSKSFVTSFSKSIGVSARLPAATPSQH